MGAPDEPAHVDPAPGSGRERLADLRVRGTGEALVWVSMSVDEHQQVTIAHLRHSQVQLGELRGAVDEGSDHVALVQAAPPGWRASSRVEWFPRSVEVRTTASGADAS